ncbi:putative hydrolase [Umbelopsis sp. PMI_123]|nr:putative hydrolase [Umbelopsis sp. PMI_123]
MATHSKIALTNVRVFDGQKLLEPATVVIDGELIGSDPAGAEVQDCEGGILLPGLIDAHVHLTGIKDLKAMSSYGITTALDMATWPLELLNSLRNQNGLTDIRSSGISASAPGSAHSLFLPKESLLKTVDEAKEFVAKRVAEGSDYIKIVADIPGPDQEIVNTLVAEAHHHGKIAIAHAAKVTPFEMAQIAKVDMITHVPLDQPLPKGDVDRMVADKCIAIPTLTMMEGISRLRRNAHYEHSHDSVTALYQAGVPILAGTDANSAFLSPFNVRHGESLHRELELLVKAGLSNLDALMATTSLPAQYFGLNDRGVIQPGRRADLILITGDPLQDISATRLLKRIWCAGIEVEPFKPGSSICRIL